MKVDTLREIDAFARAPTRVWCRSRPRWPPRCQEVEILRPDGTLSSRRAADVALNVSVILEEDGRREAGSAGGGGRTGSRRCWTPRHWQRLRARARRCGSRWSTSSAEPAPAGVMDVVLGPGWPGILLHEAVGHGLEGDFNRKVLQSAFAGLMGQRGGKASPSRRRHDPDRRGSITVDDEGTPSARNVLIEDGVLVGYMQDRQNARLMGVAPTGNGRRQSFAHAPMPRMTNTIMLGGEADPADDDGRVEGRHLCRGFGGGQVDITNGKFVFSCTEAYRVKNGRVGAPVKGATLIGDGATALRNVRAIGNDMALDPGIGTCGKAGQWVPVGVGQPSVTIGGLTVGGAQAG